MNPQSITLAGGCFWCLEAVYELVEGVTAVESGYSNGQLPNPSYEQVCSGTTGHAEVVRVSFDADRITLHEVLEIFFDIHDPTTPNRQGNDIGTQYRSGIYWHDPAQEAVVRDVVAQANAALQGRVVTEVQPLANYWRARIVRAATAVVAGAGPDGFLRCGIELAGDQSRHEAAKRRTHFVRAGGEPLADDGEDARLDAGQFGRKFQIIHAAERAAAGDGFIVPVDAEQVQRIHIPQADVLETGFDRVGNQRRILHLLVGGDDDVALARTLDRPLAAIGLDGEINHVSVLVRVMSDK